MVEASRRYVFHDEAIVPSRYIVRLHPDDNEEVVKFLDLLRKGAGKRLKAELHELNRQIKPNRITQKLAEWKLAKLDSTGLSYKAAHTDSKGEPRWEIELMPDSNHRVPRGDVVIEAQLDVQTSSFDGGTKTFNPNNPPGQATGSAAPAATQTVRVFARLSYEEQQVSKTYDMTAKHIFIGRGGIGKYADLVLHAPDDVSREHLQIRYQETSRRFEIKNTSTYGTSINGKAVSLSLENDPATGLRRDRDHWEPLPSPAVIGLAGIFFLRFEAESSTSTT